MILGKHVSSLAHIFIVILVFIASSVALMAQQPALDSSATHVYRVKAKLTAYCTCRYCCGAYSAAGRTKMGTDARKPVGVAAANWLVPLGSHVYIPGLAQNPLRIVDDTGGGMRQAARKGVLQFDVRFTSHRAALVFGKRWEYVDVLVEKPDAVQAAFFSKAALESYALEASDATEPFLQAFARQVAMIN